MKPPTDIPAWLEDHGLAELAPVFEANAITPDMLKELSELDLREMGVTALGHRKKLLMAVKELNAAEPREASWSAVASDSATPLSPQPSGKQVSTVARKAQQLRPSSAPPAPVAAVEALPPADPSTKPKRKGWSVGFLTVSIALHLIFGLGAGYWVVQQIQAKRKLQFSGGPPTASPSKRALEHKVSLQKRKNAGGAPAQARRIAVSGMAANITLPDMPAMPNASTQFVTGRMSGMGGAGFGSGLGFGNGSGMGVGGMGKGGLGLTMFGARGGGGLAGTFYDLKQTDKKEPSGVNAGNYISVVRAWIEGGCKDSVIEKYFKAPGKLYATQFLFPDMDANEAPKAYGVEKDVKPAQWVALYRGKVSPPKSGEYHFVGAADDVLVVRLNGKLVIDASWNVVSGLQAREIDPRGNYVSFPRRGYVRGEPFKVKAGEWYDIEVVVGERPGGHFWACLCVEEGGKKGFPLFRLSAGKLPKMEKPPPFEADAPLWRAISSSAPLSPLDMLKKSSTDKP